MHTELFWKILALEEKDEGLLGKNMPSDAGDRFLARELRSGTPSATTREKPEGSKERSQRCNGDPAHHTPQLRTRRRQTSKG